MPSQSPSPEPKTLSHAARHYTAEDVQTILARALELNAEMHYSVTQLQEMAAELNVPLDVLERAEADWRSHQTAQVQKRAKLTKRQRYRRQRWLQYLFGSALMIGINLATAGTLTWSIFPVLGWGLGLAFSRCDRSGPKSSGA